MGADGQEPCGALFVVATPIGNLADISERALETLRAADLIACEDTRHSRRLLDRHDIRRPLVSLHEHNEASRCPDLIRQLHDGRRIAVISDAGMPGISDPGGRLIQACLREGIPCDVIPGPSAVITALVGSGLFDREFYFGGFLPPKSGRRGSVLADALRRPETCVFFESPHRLLRSLDVLAELAPDRLVCVAREMTKAYQEFRRGPAADIAAEFHRRPSPPKGEITLVIAGAELPKWIS